MIDIGINHEFQCAEGFQLVVRRAQLEDAMDVLCWRNDPHVRAISRQHETIDLADHMLWYSKALDDPKRLLFIGLLDGKRIGIVRFDNSLDLKWEVSINITCDARGLGIGQRLLKVALRRLYSVCSSAFVLAEVNLNNEPSLKFFQVMGFKRVSDDGVFARFVLAPNTTKTDF